MRRVVALSAVSLVLVTVLVGCGGSGNAPATSAAANADKLAQVLDRGTLVLSTDTAYPPQSFSVDGAIRAATTRCAANQLTGPEVDGMDVATGKAVAAALGVEPCFVVPTWTEITAGNWGDRWDVAWGSGAINADRMTRLYMTQPYYADEQRFYVKDDSSYQVPSDLDGKTVGACASCSHEYYLKGTLEVPGVDLTPKVKDPTVVTYQAEPPGLQEVADGKIDGFLCSETVGAQAIKDGVKIRALDEAAFPLYLTGFVDRHSGLDAASFVTRISEIVRGLHADGTLKAMSIEYFGEDLATAAGAFDLASIKQVIP